MKLSSNECHCTLLPKIEDWCRQWLGVVRHQAIAWANVAPDLCRNIAWVGHNESRVIADNGSGFRHFELINSWWYCYKIWPHPIKKSWALSTEDLEQTKYSQDQTILDQNPVAFILIVWSWKNTNWTHTSWPSWIVYTIYSRCVLVFVWVVILQVFMN